MSGYAFDEDPSLPGKVIDELALCPGDRVFTLVKLDERAVATVE